MVRRNGDWIEAEVGEQLIMLSVDKGAYVGLSKVGVAIWRMLAEPCEVDAICATLQRRFDVAPEICRAEVDAFLTDLAAKGAIELDS